MMKKKDPIKGAQLKQKPVVKPNEKDVKAKMKNASKAMADARSKKEAAEEKAFKNRKKAVAATVGSMVAGGIAMFKENKRREDWKSSRFK